MTTITNNFHDLAKIANDPTNPIRTAVYVGPDEDYVEQWFVPMFGTRLYTRVDPILGTRDDAWINWVDNPAELVGATAAVLKPTPLQERDLHATLFELGWRVEERTPYNGPVGQMEWNAYEGDRLF